MEKAAGKFGKAERWRERERTRERDDYTVDLADVSDTFLLILRLAVELGLTEPAVQRRLVPGTGSAAAAEGGGQRASVRASG